MKDAWIAFPVMVVRNVAFYAMQASFSDHLAARTAGAVAAGGT